jgi:hypothetical protein
VQTQWKHGKNPENAPASPMADSRAKHREGTQFTCIKGVCLQQLLVYPQGRAPASAKFSAARLCPCPP